MDMNTKYPVLIGCSDYSCKELHGVQEVAKFICEEGLKSDVRIVEPNSHILLNTFGIYIDRIVDKEYREELLKVLIPMQMEIDGTKEILKEMEVTL